MEAVRLWRFERVCEVINGVSFFVRARWGNMFEVLPRYPCVVNDGFLHYRRDLVVSFGFHLGLGSFAPTAFENLAVEELGVVFCGANFGRSFSQSDCGLAPNDAGMKLRFWCAV
jgi:hypothetical protein